MIRSSWLTTVAFVLAVIFGAAVPGSANALTPPPPPSEIVFSFGDRIVSIAADGSDRRELTSTGPFEEGDLEGRTGDAAPQLSPTGSHLLLTRFKPAGYYGVSERIVLAKADGTGAKRILRGSRNVTFSNPAWMPDGGSVAVTRSVYKRRTTDRSVVVASLSGKSVKPVLNLPPHLSGNPKRDLATYRVPIDIGVSPDGQHLLVTISNGYRYDEKSLVLVNVKTGKKRQVGKNTRFGSFSPDGKRFVYVSSTGNQGETCTETDEESCVIQGDLFTQNLDGTGKRRLTRSRAAEENPDWSPDGERIAFEANYNLPAFGSASEIYAIAPDGSCLSALTNGSPAAVEPDWAPDSGPSDMSCGIEPREPVVADTWLPRGLQAKISVWAGPVQGNRLVTSASLAGPFRIAIYEDCAVYDAKACQPPPKFEIGGVSTCFAGAYLGLVVGNAKRAAFGQRRGVAFLRQKQRREVGRVRVITVFTGDTMLSISGNTKTTYAQLVKQIDALRPANTPEASGQLPDLYLPKGLPGTVKAVSRLVKRDGFSQTASRLKATTKQIRALVRFSNRLKLLGPVRTKNCTKEESDPFAGF